MAYHRSQRVFYRPTPSDAPAPAEVTAVREDGAYDIAVDGVARPTTSAIPREHLAPRFALDERVLYAKDGAPAAEAAAVAARAREGGKKTAKRAPKLTLAEVMSVDVSVWPPKYAIREKRDDATPTPTPTERFTVAGGDRVVSESIARMIAADEAMKALVRAEEERRRVEESRKEKKREAETRKKVKAEEDARPAYPAGGDGDCAPPTPAASAERPKLTKTPPPGFPTKIIAGSWADEESAARAKEDDDAAKRAAAAAAEKAAQRSKARAETEALKAARAAAEKSAKDKAKREAQKARRAIEAAERAAREAEEASARAIREEEETRVEGAAAKAIADEYASEVIRNHTKIGKLAKRQRGRDLSPESVALVRKMLDPDPETRNAAHAALLTARGRAARATARTFAPKSEEAGRNATISAAGAKETARRAAKDSGDAASRAAAAAAAAREKEKDAAEATAREKRAAEAAALAAKSDAAKKKLEEKEAKKARRRAEIDAQLAAFGDDDGSLAALIGGAATGRDDDGDDGVVTATAKKRRGQGGGGARKRKTGAAGKSEKGSTGVGGGSGSAVAVAGGAAKPPRLTSALRSLASVVMAFTALFALVFVAWIVYVATMDDDGVAEDGGMGMPI